MRAEIELRALAEVAPDRSIRTLDLPRRLVLDGNEMSSGSVTLAALKKLRQTRPDLAGDGVTFGVIDSEIALGHPVLVGRVIHRRNYTDEPFGRPRRHGTAIAGILAGSSDEFEGIAPAAVVYNYKVSATDPRLDGDDFDGALALRDALNDGVRVVNCSWSTGEARDGTSREALACDTAWRSGLTIVKSAGNGGPASDSLTTPGDAAGVIVVGATDADGVEVQPYSARGPTPTGHRPHLVAPGGYRELCLTSTGESGGMTQVWGTSYAAPHVAGLAGLLLDAEPHLLPDDVRARLLGTCQPLASGNALDQGAGLVAPDALLT